MNHTAIEWVVNPDGSRPGWSWNPLTGCLNGCEYCYARKLANGRLRERYLANTQTTKEVHGIVSRQEFHRGLADPFYPRFWEERCHGDLYTAHYPEHGKGKGIFVCDMGDLFGMGVPHEWTSKVMTEIELYPWHRFYLLTKQPQNLPKWSPFPDPCYVGVTATNQRALEASMPYLLQIEATVRDISLEPLLEKIDVSSYLPDPTCNFGSWHQDDKGIERWDLGDAPCNPLDWLIIGACTGTKLEMEALIQRYPELTLMPHGNKWTAQPKKEWIDEIADATDRAGIPVFLKNNLRPALRTVYGDNLPMRQEMPGGNRCR